MHDKAQQQISLLVLEAAQEISHKIVQTLERAMWRPII